MSIKPTITPNCIKPRPPSANLNKPVMVANKKKIEAKLIPEYFSQHFASSRRPRSSSASDRRPPSLVWKLMIKQNQNKENNPPVILKDVSKTPPLPKPVFTVPEIRNTFYEHMNRLEGQLDHVLDNIEVPEGFFSPVKTRKRIPLRQL
ncbi:unnamed protein product [Blepharisma stoltei]|uniref:Uncharacterized protein n=1 Tax=Blepharisma stoltei TaxID=1481888 RepID=A0AAU9K7E0_9CILI|nr:unnamed protein product [Blepharisma stoltei]